MSKTMNELYNEIREQEYENQVNEMVKIIDSHFNHKVVDAVSVTEKVPVNDAINPNHYKIGGIETIDYMRAKSTPEEFKGHLRLTAIKYLSRAGHKDDLAQEYKKAIWYIERLIEEL